jgi:aspartate racemase
VKVKRIGIVAVSAEGAALCYRTIAAEGAAILGEHDHPEIVMHTYSLAAYMKLIREGRWADVGEMMLASAHIAADAGADFLICPDNTVHQAVDRIREQSPRPWLHIAEEVAAIANQRGFRKLGILGTRYLMEGPVYGTKLEAHGVRHEIPDAADREIVNRVIFEELVYGVTLDASRREFQRIIEQLARRDCDAAVLGCTEIPLLIDDSTSSLPTIDSARTLARAALRYATDTR